MSIENGYESTEFKTVTLFATAPQNWTNVPPMNSQLLFPKGTSACLLTQLVNQGPSPHRLWIDQMLINYLLHYSIRK